MICVHLRHPVQTITYRSILVIYLPTARKTLLCQGPGNDSLVFKSPLNLHRTLVGLASASLLPQLASVGSQWWHSWNIQLATPLKATVTPGLVHTKTTGAELQRSSFPVAEPLAACSEGSAQESCNPLVPALPPSPFPPTFLHCSVSPPVILTRTHANIRILLDRSSQYICLFKFIVLCFPYLKHL